MGGDEFAVILPETDYKAAQKYCQRIKDEVVNFNSQSELSYKLSISIGMAIYDQDSKSLEDVFNQADQNMYHNKNNN